MRQNKTTQKQINTISVRVTELHTESISWFKKYIDVFMEMFPMKRKDAFTPKSVEEYSIGINKVKKRPGINPAMTYVVSPFKKIKQHLNILSL